MKRFFKILGLICLILVALVCGIIAYVVATVDLNQIKQQISETVKKETGRELLIKGDLDLSFFPWIGVEIGETHFGNAAGFSGDFVSISHARARLKLMPLFSKQIEMNTLVLVDFSLNLEQRKDGINNWDDLVKAGEQPENESGPSAKQGPTGALAFFLEGVEIRNANVNFRDDQAGSSMDLTNFNFTAGQIGLQRDIPFSADFKIKLSDPQVAGDNQIKGIANLDPKAGRIKVRDLHVNSYLKATGLPAESIDLGLNANLVFDQNRELLEVKPFELKTMLKGADIPNGSAVLTLQTALEFDARTMAANLKPLTISIPAGTIQGDLAYRQNGQLQQIDFNLAADQLDLNSLLPPGPNVSSATTDKPEAKKAVVKDNAGLRNLLVNGDLKIGRLIKDALLVTEIAMHIKLRDGVLDVSPMTASLYQGLANQAINVDLRGAAPKVNAKLDVKGVQIGDYLKAALDKEVIAGAADVKAELHLTATDAATIKRSLNGNATFKVSDGALKGVNIPDLIRRAKIMLSGQIPPPAKPQDTDFTELSGSVTIVDGLVNNNDLTMKSPLLRIAGDGNVNLPQEQINYLATANLVSSLSGQGGDDLKDLVGLPIPIRIKGSFNDLDWQLDLKSVLTEKVKSQAKGIVDEALKDPQKTLKNPEKLLEEPKKAIEGLKNLFGR